MPAHRRGTPKPSLAHVDEDGRRKQIRLGTWGSTDHIIALGERHFLRTLLKYQAYYSEARCHMSLDGNAPEARPVEDGPAAVVATLHLGGLHHRFGRAA